MPAMLSRIHAPMQQTPCSFRSGSTERVSGLPCRLISSAVASVPFFCSRDWNCSVEVTASPPHSTITSPVFRPQVRAGVPPSGSFTTTTPRANSFTPTVCPTGIRLRWTGSAARAAVVHSSRASTSAAPCRRGPLGISSYNKSSLLWQAAKFTYIPYFFCEILRFVLCFSSVCGGLPVFSSMSRHSASRTDLSFPTRQKQIPTKSGSSASRITMTL